MAVAMLLVIDELLYAKFSATEVPFATSTAAIVLSIIAVMIAVSDKSIVVVGSATIFASIWVIISDNA